MSRVRPRSHSPTALPCGSKRVLAATPRPSSPSTTTFTARRFGSACTVTGSSAASGSSSRTLSGVSVGRQPRAGRRRCAPRARRSPSRPCPRCGPAPPRPSGARRVGPCGQSCPGRGRLRRSPGAGACRRGHVDPGAVGQDGDVRDGVLRHERGRVDAERRPVAGRRRQVEAGVARQRHLHGRPAERPADDLGRGIQRRRSAAARWRRPRCRRRVARRRPVDHTSSAGRAGQRRLELGPRERLLGRDPVAGEHERDLVAVPAEGVEADLHLRRRRLAADAGDPHPVGTVVVQPDRVEPGDDVGPGVPRAGDLVEQLGGDGVAVDDAAGAGVLGDHAGAVGGELGQREAGVQQPLQRVLVEGGEVAAGGLRPALEHVPGDDRAGQRVEVVAAPAEVRDARADDERGVGDPAGDDDVGARPQALRDPEGAEVGVRGQRGRRARARRPAAAGRRPRRARRRSARPAGRPAPAARRRGRPGSARRR